MIEHFNKIEGWCNIAWYEQIKFFNSQFSLSGGITEIGVHHGKFFIMLNSFTNSNETSYAIDLFGNQELNIDKSGKGNLEIFKKNLQNYDKHQGKNVKIIAGDSLDKSIIKNLPTNHSKFVSIDGGHTHYHIKNDLEIAEKIVAHNGLIFIDDFLHPKWLGVTEGIFNYLEQKNALVPLAVGFNKLVMCNISYHQLYLKKLSIKKAQFGLLKGFSFRLLN